MFQHPTEKAIKVIMLAQNKAPWRQLFRYRAYSITPYQCRNKHCNRSVEVYEDYSRRLGLRLRKLSVEASDLLLTPVLIFAPSL